MKSDIFNIALNINKYLGFFKKIVTDNFLKNRPIWHKSCKDFAAYILCYAIILSILIGC